MMSQSITRRQLTVRRSWLGFLLLLTIACSGVLFGTESASALAVDYVKITGSDASTNRGRHWSLKDYTVNFSRNNPNTGALINPNGYSNSSTTCSRDHATLPWLAGPDQPKNGSPPVPIDAPDYDGNTLSTRGSCSNRYTDGGTNSRSWLPPSYLNWTLPGGVPGFGGVFENSSVTAACNDPTQMRGGPAPLISRFEIDVDDHSLKVDQAYGPGGIFSTFWGSTAPTNGVRLYSYGTGLIRNQFTMTAEQYEYVENGNEIKLYAMGDDWIRLYVNGTQVGTTNISGEVIETADVRHLLNPGVNVIAVQVHDKAAWRTNNRSSATTGVCYNLTVTVPEETQVSAKVSLSGSGVMLPEQTTNAEAEIDNLGGRVGHVNWQRVVYYSSTDTALHTGPYLQQQSGTNTTVPVSGLEMSDWPHEIDTSSGYICTRLSIQSSNPDTRVLVGMDHECKPIGKYPQVQISGGDLIVRGALAQVNTVRNQIDGGLYGSWVEYSIFAAGNVQSVSAAALPSSGFTSAAGGTGLTFANTGTPPGNFVSSGDLAFGSRISRDNGVWRNWPTRSIGSSHPLYVTENDISGNYINTRTTAGTVRLGGSWAGLDDSYVIHIENGDVQIRSNITYQGGTHSSIRDLPQLVIIADGDIEIIDSVTRVDAWLIAGGNVYTCGRPPGANYYSGLDSETCDESLRINGPVQAGGLYLRRTAGSEGTTTNSLSQPAEVINFRSDALLWSYGQASRSQSIRTDTVKELPPRF